MMDEERKVEGVNNIYRATINFTAEQLADDPILRYFQCGHLPPELQAMSVNFCNMARIVVSNLPRNAERSVALRKLLEAKDATIRANVT